MLSALTASQYAACRKMLWNSMPFQKLKSRRELPSVAPAAAVAAVAAPVASPATAGVSPPPAAAAGTAGTAAGASVAGSAAAVGPAVIGAPRRRAEATAASANATTPSSCVS